MNTDPWNENIEIRGICPTTPKVKIQVGWSCFINTESKEIRFASFYPRGGMATSRMRIITRPTLDELKDAVLEAGYFLDDKYVMTPPTE